MKHAFWTRLAAWVEHRRSEAWMRERGHDRWCGGCRRAYSATGSWPSLRDVGVMDQEVDCTACGITTTWDCLGMLPAVKSTRTTR